LYKSITKGVFLLYSQRKTNALLSVDTLAKVFLVPLQTGVPHFADVKVSLFKPIPVINASLLS
jgi:hypothetical protein